MLPNYQPENIEPEWQRIWEETGLYRSVEEGKKPKYYCLDYFPYPSGEGLHVGHCRNYIPTDVLSRYKRMQGFNVLHPMGWDSFGEPTEQHAIQFGVHPRETTDRNTANFKRQMRMIGTSYEWEREIDSSKPEFYRWTQWFFLRMYKRGLAYRDTNWQWWCPVCQTTLSSSEAEGGVCWRGHEGVYKREIPAWYFKITAYADELLEGLDDIHWPERVKMMQRNWIGRSEGCEIDFLTPEGRKIPVFTTRPDTLYGVTFFVIAPEHPLVAEMTQPKYHDEVQAYVNQAIRQSEIERTMEGRRKSGVYSGTDVIHPLTQEPVPVWIADYVLPTYGTGALMGVPAHDQRDLEFARAHGLPVKVVIVPDDMNINGQEIEVAIEEPGVMVNSGAFDGLPSEVGSRKITAFLVEKRLGRSKVQYRIHDWLISRQRYWGTPIPIVYCQDCGEVPLPEDQLPLLLPDMENFEPDGTGRSPLARVEGFINTTCPVCDESAQRETDTLGGFACSSWYYLRFTSPNYHAGPFEPKAMRYWMPVDLYVGGAEHAVLHLLYARFWTKVLADEGVVPFREPFPRLLNQGIMHGPDGYRMSKSRGNVVTPDEMVEEYGADALRVYELFLAPFDQDVSWNPEGIVGARRFLQKVWNLILSDYTKSREYVGTDDDLARDLHKTIRDVTERIEEFRFNTLVSTLMEFVNLLIEKRESPSSQTKTYHNALDVLLILLAPVAPYISEELWRRTGHSESVHQQTWPQWDGAFVEDQVVTIPIQVDGKVRTVIDIPAGARQEHVESQAMKEDRVQQFLDDREIRRVIYVDGKVINFVTQTKRKG